MASFRLYSTALETLEDIWFYSFTYWNEIQANHYIYQLYECFQKLADKTHPWRKLPQELVVPNDIKQPLYFYHHKKHYIFFRELSNGDIGIITLLHDAMDIPVRLQEYLNKIT